MQEEQEVRLHPHRLPGGLHESELVLELRGQLISAMPWAPEVTSLSLISLCHSFRYTLGSGILATVLSHCVEAITSNSFANSSSESIAVWCDYQEKAAGTAQAHVRSGKKLFQSQLSAILVSDIWLHAYI